MNTQIKQNNQASETAIEIEGVWKIFGDRATEALNEIRRSGISKQQVLEQYSF